MFGLIDSFGSRTIDDTSHVRVNLDGIFLYRIYTQPIMQSHSDCSDIYS